MKLESLPKIKLAKNNKMVGRGHGSGKGKTAGRGTKGQKARDSIKPGFVGGASVTRIIKRLPFRRGVGNKPGSNALGVSLTALSKLPKGSKVTTETLVEAGILSFGEARRRPLKVLGGGELSIALTVEIPVTAGAAKKIAAAGGNVVTK
jgi:large subunit ribosomal protein L15